MLPKPHNWQEIFYAANTWIHDDTVDVIVNSKGQALVEILYKISKFPTNLGVFQASKITKII